MICGISADSKQAVLHAHGKDGLKSFTEGLANDKVLFGGLRCRAIDDRGTLKSVRSKFIFVSWLGSDVSAVQRARAGTLRSEFVKLFSGCQVNVQTNDKDDMKEEQLAQLLQSSTGAHKPTGYDFEGNEDHPDLVDKDVKAPPAEVKQAVKECAPEQLTSKISSSVDIAPKTATGGNPSDIWNEIRDGDTDLNWIMLSYDGKDPKTMEVYKKSVTGLSDFVQQLDNDKILFCGLRCKAVDNRGTVRSVRNKFIFVAWGGTDTKPMQRAKMSTHKSSFQKILSGTHISIHTGDKSDLTPRILEEKLQSATGAHKPNGYDFEGSESSAAPAVEETKEQSEKNDTELPTKNPPENIPASEKVPKKTDTPPSNQDKPAKPESTPEAQAKPQRKVEDDEDSDEEEDQPKPKVAPRKPIRKFVDSDEDDDEVKPVAALKKEVKEVRESEIDTVTKEDITNNEQADTSPAPASVAPSSGGDVADLWSEIRDGTTDLNWMMLSYDGKDPNTMEVYKRSTTGLSDFVKELDGDKVLFCGLRCKAIDDRGSIQSVRNKFIFVAWGGPRTKPMQRAKMSTHKSQFLKVLSGTHISVHTSDISDLDSKLLEDKLQSATGAHKPNGYDFECQTKSA
ncbi:actin binding protein, partial [Diplonema papillatum]